MPDQIDVHVLPCLIKEPGPADVKRRFSDRVFRLDDQAAATGAVLGGFTLHDICGPAANDVEFQLETSEHLERDVYASQHGSDPFLGREHLCGFLRGRCLRGSRLNLSALRCRASTVHISTPASRTDRLVRHPSIRTKTINEASRIDSVTLWDADRDISPLAPFLEGYKHIQVARALSHYSGEREFVLGLKQ
ncbi:DUF4111 domain-containing protein [Babesia caballi]|uniref:DUF4111 domain-containing protein n=1 Tax=Babesia caballi TaxID=5871 RepID=A0AAV4LTY5_BABCB|nr:DUF4111 domain-containing protein [Babesia caballi]